MSNPNEFTEENIDALRSEGENKEASWEQEQRDKDQTEERTEERDEKEEHEHEDS